MRAFLIYLFFLLILVLYGLYDVYNSLGSDEIQSKYENSCIESLYYKTNKVDNENIYRLFKCEDSKLIIVGLPIKNQTKGYVMIIANTEHRPFVKIFPENLKFIVKNEWIYRLKSQIQLSEEVEICLKKGSGIIQNRSYIRKEMQFYPRIQR